MPEYSEYTFIFKCPECGYNDSQYNLVCQCCSRCGWDHVTDGRWAKKEIGRWRTEYKTVKFLWFFSRQDKYYVWEPKDTMPWYEVTATRIDPKLKQIK